MSSNLVTMTIPGERFIPISTDQIAEFSQFQPINLNTYDESNNTQLCYKFTPLVMYDHTLKTWVKIDSLTKQTHQYQTKIQEIIEVASPRGTALYASVVYTPISTHDPVVSTSSTATSDFYSEAQDLLREASSNGQLVSESSAEVSDECIMDKQTYSSSATCEKASTLCKRSSPLTKTNEHVISVRSNHNSIDDRDFAAGILPTCGAQSSVQSFKQVTPTNEAWFEDFCKELGITLPPTSKVDPSNKADSTPSIKSSHEIQSPGLQDSQSFYQATEAPSLISTPTVENLRKGEFTHCNPDDKTNSDDTLERYLDEPNGKTFTHRGDAKSHVEMQEEEDDSGIPDSASSQCSSIPVVKKPQKRRTKKFIDISRRTVKRAKQSFVCRWTSCQLELKSKQSLDRHEKIHKKCPCRICSDKNKVFNRTFQKSQHVCHIPDCYVEFERSTGFLRHFFQQHEDQKSFTCDYCNKKFATKHAIISHIKTHNPK